MPDTIHLGLVQFSMTPDVDANMAKAIDGVREAHTQGASVVCLPELFRSPYFCQTEDADHFALAEAIPGPSTDALGEVTRELGVVVVGSLFERRAKGLYHNTAAILDGEKGYVGKYRKMHIPDDPLFYEKYYFAPGDLGFHTWETSKGDLGVLICWDQWYPEAARLTALQGADVLFYPTAIGWHPSEKAAYGHAQREAWITAQRAHAISNGVYVAAVNRTGFEPTDWNDEGAQEAGRGIQFWGGSFVAGPDGQIVAQMGEEEEGVLVVETTPDLISGQRHGWPFLRDRRIDAYSDLTQRYLRG